MDRRRNLTIFGLLATAALFFAVVSGIRPEKSSVLHLEASISGQKFYEDAFSLATGTRVASASMVLVNHHLLASGLMAQAITVLRTDEPTTVVLISPDHFGRGKSPISTVAAEWSTPYGILSTDHSKLPLLSAADIDAYPFPVEHGVNNVVAFIKREMPQAMLVPIIIKDRAVAANALRLAEQLTRLPGRVIIVGSFDFTHDSTMRRAQINDERSIEILRKGSPNESDYIVVDSHAGIRVLLEYARLKGLRFNLLANSNSALLTGRLDQQDVTSYITGFWTPSNK